ncbi:hypothetical protein LCGC14_1258690 [marine sediment metagenome]|uniref:Major capsid protein n=1 Tax=marine sediment metagenome TaxID=412755 RepID=A0A0F9LMQ2_9ZZZZ
MSFQITTAFVSQFKANILLLSQQMVSLIRQVARMEDVTGDTMFVERISATSAQLISSRHGDTPQIDTPHSRRKLTMADYNWADLIDNVDKLKMLIDPQSTYAQNAVMAFNRTIDEVLITALGGNAFGGHTGGTTIANIAVGECRLVGSDGVIIAAGSNFTDTTETPLTIAKLLTCKQLLDDAVIDDSRQRYFLCNPFNINQLLNTTEVKSADFNTVKALAMGQIDTFMGFKFIKSTLLSADGTDTGATNCYAFAQDAIVLAISKEPTVRVSERDDKNYSTQVYVEMSIGATRVEGPAVVEINLKTT